MGRIAAKAAPTTLLAALLLASNLALADNECETVGEDPSDNGATADTYNCPDASYPDGVTYDADGNLTVNFTNGSITEVEDVGIDLTATGTDSITFDSATTETEIRNRNITGALLGVTTVNGDIDIDTETLFADRQGAQGITHAIYAESTGSGSIDITTAGSVDATSSISADDAVGIEAITDSGTIDITIQSESEVGGNAAAIRAGGGPLVLNNNGTITGALDFTDLTAGYTFNHNAGATWTLRSDASDPASITELGAGTLNNAGTIVFAVETEAGTNTSLSAGRGSVNRGITDLLMAPGTAYSGDDGVLEFAVIPGETGQTDCTNPTQAGCLYLAGGSTAGTTRVRLVFLKPRLQELSSTANTGIVLVDVGGGSSSADHFVLDPGSVRLEFGSIEEAGTGGDVFDIPVYAEDPVYGAVLDLGGVLDYALLYNPDNQQHVLATVPQREGVEYVSFIHEALSIWHTTSDAVAGRQSALRDGGERGAWFRIVGEQTSRESAPTFSDHGNDFTYEQDYSLWTGAAIAGFDMTASDEHVFGFHIGYVSANTDYEGGSSTTNDTVGTTVGVYGGWWRDGLTFDGTINANLLELDHRFGSNPKELEASDSRVQSLGARLEMGYQAPILGERLYLQPLAAVSYASADIKDLELQDNDLSFEDAKSLRIGIGMRVGGDLATAEDAGKLGYWLTARRWEEREGNGRVLYEVRDGADLAVRDDLSGAFNEIDLGVNWGNAEGDLSGYVSGGAKFDKDDNNDSYNFSVGIRKNW